MKILFCGGGTAGHINPSIALAEEICKSKDNTVAFVSRRGGDENRLIENMGYKLYTVNVKGLSKNPKKLIQSLILSQKAKKEARKIIEDFKPDIVFSTGGYVSYPVLNQAVRKNIKTILHESNLCPGLVTKMFAGKCNLLLLPYGCNNKQMQKRKNSRIVGTPIRSSFENNDKALSRKAVGIKDTDFFILSQGGSLGAERLNNTILSVMKNFSIPEKAIHHIHSIGRRYFEFYQKEEQLLTKGIRGCKLVPYIDNMPLYLSAADFVISRCGAVSIAEIVASATPAILIPSPNVTDNHQYKNAKLISDANAAILIEEKDLSQDIIIKNIKNFLNDKSLRKSIEDNIVKLKSNNPRMEIVALIEQLYKKNI